MLTPCGLQTKYSPALENNTKKIGLLFIRSLGHIVIFKIWKKYIFKVNIAFHVTNENCEGEGGPKRLPTFEMNIPMLISIL